MAHCKKESIFHFFTLLLLLPFKPELADFVYLEDLLWMLGLQVCHCVILLQPKSLFCPKYRGKRSHFLTRELVPNTSTVGPPPRQHKWNLDPVAARLNLVTAYNLTVYPLHVVNVKKLYFQFKGPFFQIPKSTFPCHMQSLSGVEIYI